MKFAFVGGTQRGFEVLKEIVLKGYIPSFCAILKEDEHEIEKVSPQIGLFLESKGIKYIIEKKLSDLDYEKIKSSDLDFIIVCGWRTLIDPSINNYLKLGMIAAHDSLLPKYRGFAPINWAIINGEKETGVTLFRIDKGEVDSGEIIAQKVVKIKEDDYGWHVYQNVIKATIEIYLDFFLNFETNKIVTSKQNELEATYTCKRTPDDGRIDWDKSSKVIYDLIRAIAHPYPGAFCEFDSKIYSIRRAELGKNNKKNFSGRISGRIISINSDSIEVLCGQGSISIIEWECRDTGEISSPNKIVKSITSKLT